MFKKTGFAVCALSALVACGGGGGGGGADAPSSNLPSCASSGKNAFDTYGSAAFSTVIGATAGNVEASLMGSDAAMLGSSFMLAGSAANGSDYADDQATFLAKLTAFTVFAFGGPSTSTIGGVSYNGDIDMVAAHTGMNITSDQFDYFITNDLVPALTSSGVSGSDVSSCFAPVVTSAAFKASIVGH